MNQGLTKETYRAKQKSRTYIFKQINKKIYARYVTDTDVFPATSSIFALATKLIPNNQWIDESVAFVNCEL